MKKKEISDVLYDLYKITGFRMSLHDTNFVEIAAYPQEKSPICAAIHKIPGEYDKCHNGDKIAFTKVSESKRTVIYKCRYGLVEAVAPLYNFGILTGYLMAGQIRDDMTDVSEIRERLAALDIDKNELDSLLLSIKLAPSNLIESYIKIMTVCAQYLTLSNAMPSLKPSIAEAARQYIYENLDKKITIKDICDVVNCSKTTLIATFKKEFGITVNALITKAKLEEAEKLLIAGEMSINEIAMATGFYDQAYFCKVFSQQYGIPPSEYKKR